MLHRDSSVGREIKGVGGKGGGEDADYTGLLN